MDVVKPLLILSRLLLNRQIPDFFLFSVGQIIDRYLAVLKSSPNLKERRNYLWNLENLNI